LNRGSSRRRNWSRGCGRSSWLRDFRRLLRRRRRFSRRIAEQTHQNLWMDCEVSTTTDDDEDQHQKKNALFHVWRYGAFFSGSAEDDGLIHVSLRRIAGRSRFLGEEYVQSRQCIHRKRTTRRDTHHESSLAYRYCDGRVNITIHLFCQTFSWVMEHNVRVESIPFLVEIPKRPRSWSYAT